MRTFSNIKKSLSGARTLLGLCIILPLGSRCYAQTDYFIQDFSQPVGYTSSTPNNTQFNTISTSGSSTFSTSGGNLSMTRTTAVTPSQVAFVRNTNLSPVPSTLYVEVDVSVANVTETANGAAIFNIGQSFGTTAPPNLDVFARFSINLGVNNTYQIRNVPGLASGVTANSNIYANTQTVKVIVAMNNGSMPITYFDPRDANAPQIPLQPGTYDIWVNNVALVSGRGKVAGSSGNVTLTNFNFFFNTGQGTITLDNLRMRDISGVLPVKLTYFNAEPIDNRVELVWETSWEKDSREFVVQRSSDLKEFGDIGRVAAVGDADGRRQYSFVDADPLPGANYYRLRMVDKNDSYAYSKVKDVVVRLGQPTLWVASNPSSGDRIRFRAPGAQASALRLTTVLGQGIDFRLHTAADGYGELIPASALAPGMYVLTLDQDGLRSQTRVMVH